MARFYTNGNISGILKDTRGPQGGVGLIEVLEYIIEALTILCENSQVTESATEGSAVLIDTVKTTAVKPEILTLVTGLNEPTLDGFLKKAKVLFEELLQIGKSIKTNTLLWHKIYENMKKLLQYATSDDPKQALQIFQQNITELVQLTESCNTNTDKLWQCLTKFSPKANPHDYMQHFVRSIASAMDTYTL